MSSKLKEAGRTKGVASGLHAVILAGGKGVRLRPFTVNFPKPLVPLGDKPVLEILMQRLADFGVTDITLTLGHLAELVKAYFQHRHTFISQLKLRYIDEEEPTGTAGSLSLVPDLTSTFLVMNGDLLTDLNFHELVAFHQQQKAALTIAVHSRQVKIDFGVLELGDDFQVRGYVEKPQKTYYVSMGIYVYEPRVLHLIERGKYLDFPDLVLRLLENKEKVCGFTTNCMWLDIGRLDDYAKAQELFSDQAESAEHV